MKPKGESNMERTTPLKMHKNVVIGHLEKHPEDLKKIVPAWKGTASELIERLRRDKREWIHEFDSSWK